MDSQKIVKDLLNEFKESDLTEFEMETAELRLRFGRGVNAGSGMASGNSAVSAGIAEGFTSAPETVKESAPAAGTDDNLEPVKAPLVGTFYASPAEDADPYVQVGEQVQKGKILAIVEAMKLMNEIESEFDGTIEEILVENGAPVEYGQPLFIVR